MTKLIASFQDIDECLNVTCSGENSECVNTEGNYSCQCEPGFTGDGHNCTGLFHNNVAGHNLCDVTSLLLLDINECSNDRHTCPDGSYCINLNNGSYHCKPNGKTIDHVTKNDLLSVLLHLC